MPARDYQITKSLDPEFKWGLVVSRCYDSAPLNENGLLGTGPFSEDGHLHILEKLPFPQEFIHFGIVKIDDSLEPGEFFFTFHKLDEDLRIDQVAHKQNRYYEIWHLDPTYKRNSAGVIMEPEPAQQNNIYNISYPPIPR